MRLHRPGCLQLLRNDLYTLTSNQLGVLLQSVQRAKSLGLVALERLDLLIRRGIGTKYWQKMGIKYHIPCWRKKVYGY